MSTVARRSGVASARWLALACAGVAAVAIGIATLDDDAAIADATGALPPADAQPVPELAPTPRDVDDVVSRVEAALPPAEMPVGETSLAARKAVSSHIGPPLDPETENGGRSDDPPSHIGEHLDPDDEYASVGTGEVSHIGEYLDPLANE